MNYWFECSLISNVVFFLKKQKIKIKKAAAAAEEEEFKTQTADIAEGTLLQSSLITPARRLLDELRGNSACNSCRCCEMVLLSLALKKRKNNMKKKQKKKKKKKKKKKMKRRMKEQNTTGI